MIYALGISILLGTVYGLWFQLKCNKAQAALKATGKELEHSLTELELTRALAVRKDAALTMALERYRALEMKLVANPAVAVDVLNELGLYGYEGSPVHPDEVPDGSKAQAPAVPRDQGRGR